MFEFLIEILLQIVVDLVWELITMFGWESVAHSLRRDREADPMLAALGYALLGSVVGVISVGALPEVFLPRLQVRGLSLLLSPAIAGAIMQAHGDWRRRRNLPTTLLATFWGGATFAFFVALSRLVMLVMFEP